MVNEKDTIDLWYLLILNYLTNKDKLNINHGLRKISLIKIIIYYQLFF